MACPLLPCPLPLSFWLSPLYQFQLACLLPLLFHPLLPCLFVPGTSPLRFGPSCPSAPVKLPLRFDPACPSAPDKLPLRFDPSCPSAPDKLPLRFGPSCPHRLPLTFSWDSLQRPSHVES